VIAAVLLTTVVFALAHAWASSLGLVLIGLMVLVH
jgi:hypothetical protein